MRLLIQFIRFWLTGSRADAVALVIEMSPRLETKTLGEIGEFVLSLKRGRELVAMAEFIKVNP